MISEEDLRWDIYWGPEDTPDTEHYARVTHRPTGLQAKCGGQEHLEENQRVALAMLEAGLRELGEI